MYLVVGNNIFTIKDQWIPRWSFLTDYKEATGSNNVHWTYTDLSQIEEWIALNKRMDMIAELDKEYDAARAAKPYDDSVVEHHYMIEYKELTMGSKIYDTLLFMSPGPSEAYMYVYVDDALLPHQRLELLRNTGRFARQYHADMPYNNFERSRRIAGKMFADELRIADDPVYVPQLDMTDDQYADYKVLALSFPYDVLTGLVQRALQASVTEAHKQGGDPFLTNGEWIGVPWQLIDWDDVRTYVLSEESKERYNESSAELTALMEDSHALPPKFRSALKQRDYFATVSPAAIIQLLAGVLQPYSGMSLSRSRSINRKELNAATEEILPIPHFDVLLERIELAALQCDDNAVLFYCVEVLGIGPLIGIPYTYVSAPIPRRRDVLVAENRYAAVVIGMALQQFRSGNMLSGVIPTEDVERAVIILSDSLGTNFLNVCSAMISRLETLGIKDQVMNATTGEYAGDKEAYWYSRMYGWIASNMEKNIWSGVSKRIRKLNALIEKLNEEDVVPYARLPLLRNPKLK